MQIDIRKLSGGADAQTLFVPVAAIDGWTCYSGREKVEITPVLGGFMGITIPQTAETLTFTFCPPGLRFGAAVSMAAVLLMLGMLLLEKRKNHAKAADTAGYPESVSLFLAACYKVAWIAGIIFVYLIPNIGMVCYMVWKILKG